MKKTTLILFAIAAILGVSSCKEKDTPTLGTAPTEADAAFTYAPSAGNANIIDFMATNTTMTSKWDFGNGILGEGTTAQGTYPNKGTYTVTHTVFNSGGSASSSQDIVIAQDDQSLLSNPLFTILTGGVDGGGSKTWVLDSTREGHMGVGPVAGNWPEWWSALSLDKAQTGLYDDQFVFKLDGFKFDQITNGDIYVKTGHETDFADPFINKGDFTATYANQMNQSWTIIEGTDTTIEISGTAFIGMFTGVRSYRVETIAENELTLSYVDTKDATVRWYVRLVPEDFPIDGGGGGGGNTSTVTLPINFEEATEVAWTVFGGSTYSVVANPNSAGINTSAKVLETIHGGETWAGLFVDLKDNLDFTAGKPTISVKVWAPATGTMRIKIENIANTADVFEKDVEITTANAWQEVSVDFSEAAAGTYARIVLFPGWDVANAGTFYIDDVTQK